MGFVGSVTTETALALDALLGTAGKDDIGLLLSLVKDSDGDGDLDVTEIDAAVVEAQSMLSAAYTSPAPPLFTSSSSDEGLPPAAAMAIIISLVLALIAVFFGLFFHGKELCVWMSARWTKRNSKHLQASRYRPNCLRLNW